MSAPYIDASLSSFADAEPLGANDAQFVTELRELLTRYGNADRFGLCLLHQHFEVAADEILFESNDPQRRTLAVTTEKLASLPDFKPTMWRLSPFQVLQGCAEDHCKSPVQVLQGCAEDHCKSAVQVLQGCAEDHCKSAVQVLQGCAEDHCK